MTDEKHLFAFLFVESFAFLQFLTVLFLKSS